MLSASEHHSLNSPTQPPILSCDFELKPGLNHAYKLNISFYSDLEKNNLLSTRTVLIRKELQAPVSNNSVCDIYSFNGIGSSKNKKLFHNKNFQIDTLNELDATMNTFLAEQQSGHIKNPQILFVLDLKVPDTTAHTSYTLKEVIAEAEKKFLAFLTDTTQGNLCQASVSFKQTLMKAKPQYLIAEGSIKADFINLNFLSSAEKLFLQTRDGSPIFCQLIEFMMNAFKRGEQIIIKLNDSDKEEVLSRQQYFKKIDPNAADYCPANKSITFYPRPYKEIALHGTYTQTMQRCGLFSLQTQVHEHDVVEMTTVSNMQQNL